MKTKKYLWTLYLIITTIVISIGTQIYFNYKNYQKNKQQFINEVQISLDNATDVYYAELVKSAPVFDELFTNINTHDIESVNVNKTESKMDMTILMDSLKSKSQKTISSTLTNKQFSENDSTAITIYIFDGKFEDKSNITMDWESYDKRENKSNKLKNKHDKLYKRERKVTDSIKFIRHITKLVNSISSDSLNFKKLDSIVTTEFKRKNIQLSYQLNHYRFGNLIASNTKIDTINTIKTFSKSVYLKRAEKIELRYPNQTKTYLKKGLLGILLSLLLSIAIILSLFYLLNIINKQKQIAEIKNDFISNITHEFKTPITTIGLATEALKVFSRDNNQIKTDEYLDITKNQIVKLNKMVEKVLETSVLEKDKLLLDKQPTDIVKLINQCVNKQFLHDDKSIKFSTEKDKIILNLDTFHFENAINNLIDNAIKYGGNKIGISLKSKSENIIITIRDNGKIKSDQKAKLFDKFYRIPKGNTHNIKGFGIGLYYTKKIIEKHQGSIIIANTLQTTFIIKLPKNAKQY